MFKPTKLLKIVSVLFIISAVLGMIGTAILYIMIPKMQEIPGVDMSILDSALTPLNLAMAVVSSVVSVAAGIFGFGGRSKKGAAISMGVYTAVLVASVVQLMASGMFTAFAAVDFILPVLYWWGLYQSE
ncbi:hypothetical protein C818_01279 [Lachnospiraceae bacterium MD308]|nr:hypothetical protein C818_01279 [Lachnospiraceae bacterium MD308]MCI8502786.1 hypothetical protein [Dorea sp.]